MQNVSADGADLCRGPSQRRHGVRPGAHAPAVAHASEVECTGDSGPPKRGKRTARNGAGIARNKKLVETSASLLGTRALLLGTRS